MIALYYVGILILTIGIFFAYVFARKKNKVNFALFLKILSIVLISVFTIRYMSGADAIQNTLSLTNDVFSSKFENFVSISLNWLLITIVLFVTLLPFFDIKHKHIFVTFFVLPICLACFGCFYLIGKGIIGTTAFEKFNFRLPLMAVEVGLCLSFCLCFLFEKFAFSTLDTPDQVKKGFGKAKDYLCLLYIIPLALATMPSYVIQSYFGYYNTLMEVKSFSKLHRMVLYIGLVLPLLVWFVLRKKDYQTKKFALLYIAIGTLISFSLRHKFESFLDVTAWPFHLCNTAMYIVPLCVAFKWDKLFYFTYFINIFGAFAAMAMPNYADGTNLFSQQLVNFYINHYIAFFMPILMVSLKLYPRPKIKQFYYSMFGFGIYFVLALVFNAWFSNYGTVDYFFLNSNFIPKKLGTWAENLLNVELSFNIGNLGFKFYPIYQVLFFLCYVLIGLGMWFLFEQGYAFADSLSDIANRKKKIRADILAFEYQQQLKENNMEQNKIENHTPSLVLKNFTKRYGSSNVYAVKDATLQINGGEIFGFLGHNGAGKSTIIKSIVGIQPITSGTITVCGYDVERQSVLAKRMIGFVPDHYALYEKLTGREYINYVADLWGVSQEERDKQIKKYVELFELSGAFDNQIKTYSHGMKQKITIISALVHNPKVWILDEPLTGLDPTSIFQVKQCMKQHAKEGNIVFFSSHIIDVVETICDRIAIIKKGHILTVKSLKEIEQTTTLEQFYLEMTNQDVQLAQVGKTTQPILDNTNMQNTTQNDTKSQNNLQNPTQNDTKSQNDLQNTTPDETIQKDLQDKSNASAPANSQNTKQKKARKKK